MCCSVDGMRTCIIIFHYDFLIVVFFLLWQELVKENVVHVVRVCDPTYDKSKMQAVGIEVHDWPFADGDPPPDAIISNWLSLIKATVRENSFFCRSISCDRR